MIAKRRATATMARLRPTRGSKRSNTARNCGSFALHTAAHAHCSNSARNAPGPLFKICPRRTTSPELYSLGVRPK